MKKLSREVRPLDDGAWEEAVRDVHKLPETPERPEAPLIIEDIIPSVDYRRAYRGNNLKNLEIGNTDNIDRRTADKFKRGEFPIQKRLDLHGYNEKSAAEAVEEFIKSAYVQGLRCVLIITGKGLKRETDDWYESRGIIRERVPQWLNCPELRPLILSFSHALPADGGEGALYILLRRSRP